MKTKTNWELLANLSDEEIDKAAESDPDTIIPTDQQLSQFKRVNPIQDIDVKAIRLQLHLSQDKFAIFFGVSKRTIQEWEQKRKRPNSAARNFLKVVQYAPDVVQKALENNKN